MTENNANKNIYKVLIVDDSIVFRKMMESVFGFFDSFQIMGSVWNGTKVKAILDQGQYPDLITLDVEMPEMDGIETLQMIQQFNEKLPAEKKMQVLMVSSKTKVGADVTIRALELGAYDFITKPEGNNQGHSQEILKTYLESKLSFFAEKKKSFAFSANFSSMRKETVRAINPYTILAIGISTGGPKTLSELLPDLTQRIDIPIVIAQHMPADFTVSLAAHLNSKCQHKVVEAQEDMVIENNTVYLAPGEKNLVLRWNDKSQPICSLNTNPAQNGCFPSADILFRSVANLYGKKTLALIMTGMGQDGTAGLGAIKRQGGFIIAQGEKSSTVWGMPARAIEAGHVDQVLELEEIADFISRKLLY